jgi:hypothetical protein
VIDAAFQCARCEVGSHLPFVGFDCETFMDPTQRTLSSQIVSIIQLASFTSSRCRSLYGIFDMLALRLQFDLTSLAEFAQRLFCSRDFILLSKSSRIFHSSRGKNFVVYLAYSYAGDTSSLLENYPSMSAALMQGTAVIDLFRVQQYVRRCLPCIRQSVVLRRFWRNVRKSFHIEMRVLPANLVA